jgi:hypothetical protein
MERPNNILLVDPPSRNAYPPLGLLKIATYHKIKGDIVNYVYGMDRWYADQFWDLIYISSIFTYDFNKLIKTIRFYSSNLFNYKNIMVGGVAATLMADEVEALTGIKPHYGLLNDYDEFLANLSKIEKWASYLNSELYESCIDVLPPDYSIMGRKNRYNKILDEAYILYVTKGCPNRCSFCAVHILEPKFVDYIPIFPRIEYMRNNFGERLGLLFLDNNVAASKEYFRIIDEIKELGFYRGSKLNNKMRFVDFNQGMDIRLLDSHKMKKLSEIAIKPLRLAFDDIRMEKLYIDRMLMAIDSGINYLSNYMLYNCNDKPIDLYKRLKVTIDINEKNDVKIFSFPMKFVPLTAKDRSFIGLHWSKRQLRAIQLIINVTGGIVSHRRDFFEHAFGSDEDEYERILHMPFEYILHRVIHENDGSIDDWNRAYSELSESQRKQFITIICKGRMQRIPTLPSKKLTRILEHYRCELTAREAIEAE